MMRTEARRGLVRLVTARVVVGTVLLGWAVILQLNAPETFPAEPFFLLVALTFALTVIYALTLSFASRHAWLIALQLGTDAATISAFVLLTGGISSYFALLYALPIIGASMLLSRSGGLWLALLSTCLYGGLVLGQYLAGMGYLGSGWLTESSALLPPVRFAQYTVAVDTFAFFAVAFLSGSLAESLRRADQKLALASTAIADLKAFNQHVIDSLTGGLVTTDRTGRILTFNRAAEAITEYQARAVVGRPVAEVLQFPSHAVALVDRELEGLDSQRFDIGFSPGSGVTKDLGASIAHLITPGGRTGYLVTFQDVTAIRRLEREGRRKQRLAAVGEMAAGIAHEIRNPLASMLGSVQILRAELPLSPEQAQLMDIVLRESERLNETIRSFLAYARPQRRAATRFDVGRLLRDTAALLRNSPDVREDHRIDVETSADEVWFEADEHQLRQIVWNLATNGLRAMPQGGTLRLAARIENGRAATASAEAAADRRSLDEGWSPGPPSGALGERALPEDGALCLEVQDQGVGIPAEELDGIFQPFHGGFAKGSGLGLAIVQRIVSDYDGEIHVASDVGKGTSVKVTLPIPSGVGAVA